MTAHRDESGQKLIQLTHEDSFSPVDEKKPITSSHDLDNDFIPSNSRGTRFDSFLSPKDKADNVKLGSNARFFKSFVSDKGIDMSDGVLLPVSENIMIGLRLFVLSSLFKMGMPSNLMLKDIPEKRWPRLEGESLFVLTKLFADKIEYTGPLLSKIHHACFTAILDCFYKKSLSITSYQEISCNEIRESIGLSKNKRNNDIVRHAIAHLTESEITIYEGAFIEGLKEVWLNRYLFSKESRSFIEDNFGFIEHIKNHRIRTGFFEKTSGFDPNRSDGSFVIRFTPIMMIMCSHVFRVHLNSKLKVNNFKENYTFRIIEIIRSFKGKLYEMGSEKWCHLLLESEFSKQIQGIVPENLNASERKEYLSRNGYLNAERKFLIPFYRSLQEAEASGEILPGWSMVFRRPVLKSGSKKKIENIEFKTRGIIRPSEKFIEHCKVQGILQQSLEFRLLTLLHYSGYCFYMEEWIDFNNQWLSPDKVEKIIQKAKKIHRESSQSYADSTIEGHQLNRIVSSDLRVEIGDECPYVFAEHSFSKPCINTRDLIANLIIHPLVRSKKQTYMSVNSNTRILIPSAILNKRDAESWESILDLMLFRLKDLGLISGYLDFSEVITKQGRGLMNLDCLVVDPVNPYIDSGVFS